MTSYNSVIFLSLAAPSQYNVIYADERIFYSEEAVQSALDNIHFAYPNTPERKQDVQNLLEASYRYRDFDNLTVADCITEYRKGFLTSRRDVILVHSFSSARQISIEWDQPTLFTQDEEIFSWICSFPVHTVHPPDQTPCRLRLDAIGANVANWRPHMKYRWSSEDEHITYCLSEPTTDLCRVNFSIYTAVGVVVCNVVKLVILAYTALYLAPDCLLVLGDGIRSFLSRPDIYSKNSCLLSMTSLLYPTDIVFKSATNISELASYILIHILYILTPVDRDSKGWAGGRELISIPKRWLSSVSDMRLILGGCS